MLFDYQVDDPTLNNMLHHSHSAYNKTYFMQHIYYAIKWDCTETMKHYYTRERQWKEYSAGGGEVNDRAHVDRWPAQLVFTLTRNKQNSEGRLLFICTLLSKSINQRFFIV